jgi:beta-aspartyl-peptidase (threonine type)
LIDDMRGRISLIVHGGAGEIPDAERPDHLRGLEAALTAGWNILASGGAAIDAVVAAIEILEDDPTFDAGRGSVLRLDGSIGMDASIMIGSDRRAGAVAGLRSVRHPIQLARIVLERTPHVLIIGEGAESLARENGLELCDPDFFVVEKERERLERILAARSASTSGPQGTVGAVALDRRGSLVAGTSTGGAPGAHPGRVGDSPVIGAGTWADERAGGVSCTGRGENMLRTTLARELARELARGVPAPRAARWALDYLRDETGGTGGVICLDRDGLPGAAWSTLWMGTLSRTEAV